jgi:recombination protein RecA
LIKLTKSEALFKEFNKKYKTELFTVGTVVHNCSRIPFSSPRANYMLYGGVPRGRITEFAGEEGSGKTTTALDIAGNAQKLFLQEWEEKIQELESKEKLTKEQQGKLLELRESGPKKVLWVDCENTFDDDWSEKLGVNVKEMYYMAPDSLSAEEIFDMVTQLIDAGEIGLAVIDSLGMMVSQQEMEKDIEESTYGGISRALTKFSKKVELACARTNCALIGINQVRDNLNAGYGGPSYVTPGGKCWKHVCSVRLMFRQGTPFDQNFKDVKKSCENPYGHKVQISVAKTKICKPDRKLGFYTLTYDHGIEPFIDIIDIAISKDVIHQAGAWFTFIDIDTGEVLCNTDEDGNLSEIKVQGQANLMPFLKNPENDSIKAMVEKYVNRLIL